MHVEHYFEGEGEWKKEFWKVKGYGDLKISYDVEISSVIRFGNEHVGYLGKEFGVAMAEWFLLVPADTMKPVKVKFVLPEGWKAYTPWTFKDGFFMPEDTEQMALSVVAFGEFEIYSKRIGDTNVTVCVHKSIDSRLRMSLANDSFKIFEYQTELFGVSVYDRYPPKADDGLYVWGGEHANSQGVVVRDYAETLRMFSHQIFHKWNGWCPYGMYTNPEVMWDNGGR